MNNPLAVRRMDDLALVWDSIARSCLLVASAVLLSPWLLITLKMIIGLVSAYDVFLTIKYVEYLPLLEVNPIGRWLMGLEQEMGPAPTCELAQIGGFIAAKFSGNFIALATIELIAVYRRSWAVVIAASIALLQLVLLFVLTNF